MQTGIIITLSVLLGIFLLFVLIGLIHQTVRNKMKKRIQDRFHGHPLVKATTRANFLGKLSKKGRQIRGNGALVLTVNTLYFIRALPHKEYAIPLTSIKKISLQRAFNGKSVLASLLCIDYDTGAEPDAMGWAVPDPENWKETIENEIIKIKAS